MLFVVSLFSEVYSFRTGKDSTEIINNVLIFTG